jgi:hypothetical protein
MDIMVQKKYRVKEDEGKYVAVLQNEKEIKDCDKKSSIYNNCSEPETDFDIIEEDEIDDEEDEEDDDEDYEISDVIVKPADGMLAKYRDEEVCLLFFYCKPGIHGNKKKVFKGIAEFRIAPSKFMKIAENIQEIAQNFKKNQNRDCVNNFMFA